MYNFYDDMDYLEKVAAEAGDPTEMYNRYASRSGKLMAGGMAAGFIPHPIAGAVGNALGLAGSISAYQADKLRDQANIDYDDPKQYHRAKRVSSQWKSPAAALAAAPLAGAALYALSKGKGKAAAGLYGAAMLPAGYGIYHGVKSLYHGAKEALN